MVIDVEIDNLYVMFLTYINQIIVKMLKNNLYVIYYRLNMLNKNDETIKLSNLQQIHMSC